MAGGGIIRGNSAAKFNMDWFAGESPTTTLGMLGGFIRQMPRLIVCKPQTIQAEPGRRGPVHDEATSNAHRSDRRFTGGRWWLWARSPGHSSTGRPVNVPVHSGRGFAISAGRRRQARLLQPPDNKVGLPGRMHLHEIRAESRGKTELGVVFHHGLRAGDPHNCRKFPLWTPGLQNTLLDLSGRPGIGPIRIKPTRRLILMMAKHCGNDGQFGPNGMYGEKFLVTTPRPS